MEAKYSSKTLVYFQQHYTPLFPRRYNYLYNFCMKKTKHQEYGLLGHGIVYFSRKEPAAAIFRIEKFYLSNKPHGITSPKTVILIRTGMRSINLTKQHMRGGSGKSMNDSLES
jgi:hypothetical protein